MSPRLRLLRELLRDGLTAIKERLYGFLQRRVCVQGL